LGDSIGVKGLPWCREGHRFIGKASYAAVVDAGTLAFATLRAMATISSNRLGMLQYGLRCRRFDVIEQNIDGQG
jgi:hypothetical protein